jgi:glyoxylase-like metal-dependent hydrolase (beta-lactamase superfamily II)
LVDRSVWGASALASAAALLWAAGVGAAPQAPPQGGGRPAETRSAGIRVLPVQGNVYMLAGGGGNVTLQVEPPTRPPRVPGTYRGGYGVLLVDSGNAAASEGLAAAIRGITAGSLRYIVNTHIHPDHIGGNGALAKLAGSSGRDGGMVTIAAHENVLLQLAEAENGPSGAPADAMPTDAFLDVREIWFNGESIQILHQPNAHTDGDAVVYFRRSDVISAGDVFLTTSYPIIETARGGTLNGTIDALNRIIDIAIPESNAEGGTMIIPGHGRLADEADVVEYRNMLVIIRDRIQALVKKGLTLEQVKAAKPTLDYDFRYGSTTGAWTTEMFIGAVYSELNPPAASARPAGRR